MILSSVMIDMSSDEWHITNECPVCGHAWMDKVKAAGACPSCNNEYTMAGMEILGGEITISWQLPVYFAIVKILEANEFKMLPGGDVVRSSSGCRFYFASLVKYKSVLDFQLEWGYS
jgi:hypothetical protein